MVQRHLPALRFLGALTLLTAPALAQIQPVSYETFDYPGLPLLANQNGGTGWVGVWSVLGNGNEVVVFDTSVNPPFPLADNIGGYAGQALEFVPALRYPSPQGHNDIHDGAGFGRDGGTIWISFRTWNYQQFGIHFGGLSLFNDAGAGAVEELVIGSPWASYAWGIDDEGPVGNAPVTVPGSSDTTPTQLVCRIDHMPGQERVRLWLNPTSAHPTTPAQLDEMVHDFRWTHIRLNSGGSAGHYFWDAITIEKGLPGSVGTPYCNPAVVNTSGNSAVLSAGGSNVASSNSLTLVASAMPANQFGFFLTSQTQGNIANPGGSQGNLCLSGTIGRYVAPGQIKNGGSGGTFSLPLNLSQTPAGSVFVAINAGETWNFQAWFRDIGPLGQPWSNFTNGLSVTFQ